MTFLLPPGIKGLRLKYKKPKSFHAIYLGRLLYCQQNNIGKSCLSVQYLFSSFEIGARRDPDKNEGDFTE